MRNLFKSLYVILSEAKNPYDGAEPLRFAQGDILM
jgi:hypothetical protein